MCFISTVDPPMLPLKVTFIALKREGKIHNRRKKKKRGSVRLRKEEDFE